MESGLRSVSKLFAEIIFRIPDYQRGYSWKSKQLKEFWSDLELLANDSKHYTGVLTLESVPEKTWSKWSDDIWLIKNRNYSPQYVVDGQQRLTTIIIALQVIWENLNAADRLNYTSKDEIQTKYIYIQRDQTSGSYLFGYERDNPSYEFLKTKILGRTSNQYSTGENTIYTKNLTIAKQFFQEKIKSLKKPEIETLFRKISQQLLFNVFHIESEVDVHVAFETMNNRGLQLSTLELLKNRLIYLTTKIGEVEANIETLRRTINDSWKTVYYYLGKNANISLNDDFFLQVHLAMFFSNELTENHPKLIEHSIAALGHDNFYRTFLLEDRFTVKRLNAVNSSNRLTSNDLYKYAMDLKRVAENYYKIFFPQESDLSQEERKWIGRLNRLTKITSSREIIILLLIISTMIRDEQQRTEYLKTIEKYFFFSSLLPYRFRQKNSPTKIGPELMDVLAKKQSIQNFIDKLKNEIIYLQALPTFGENILQGMAESGYYEWQDVKYFMFEYECHLKEKAKRKTDKIAWEEFINGEFNEDHDSIEHILPQTANDEYWKSRFRTFSKPQLKRLTNSLGNLVATSKPRNSSLQKKSFPDKKGDQGAKTGYRYGSYSEIEVSTFTDWDSDSILNRGLSLLDFMEHRWGISLGDRNQKIKCLGLDFLIQ